MCLHGHLAAFRDGFELVGLALGAFHELGDEGVIGGGHQFMGRAEAKESPFVHNRHAVGQQKRFGP